MPIPRAPWPAAQGTCASDIVPLSTDRAEERNRCGREGHDGLPEQAEPNDRFGAGLLTGDLDGDGRTDLVVNAPGESWDGSSARAVR
ncbi:FG-GAP repeat protein [Streptomyces sp. NPDC006539]|uniref:FG-GAP repeat protein n=1 Tax=Streptomyces sp. NPDC006539 TaxID=3155352 RepID=UPI0033B53CE4